MCGLSGVIFKEGNPDWGLLTKMADHQFMRGPDYMEKWIDGLIGLAHNRLAIIDTSPAGNQPMQTDRWALVYNGEIYNYQELRSRISVRQWKSYNDSETLLFLIDEKGVEAALEAVEGMFSFAAYDKVDRVLWMAVDPMGIKPMYYYSDSQMFAFASSPGALTHCSEKWLLSMDALDDYLALGATRESLFLGINKVMPGTVVRREESGRTGTKKYYSIKYHENIDEAEILDTVNKSIQSVKVSDVPVSVFLSGGVDSTIVAANCQFMNAVHLASPEEKYAQLAANKYNMGLTVIHPQDYSAEKCLEDYAWKSGDCSMASIIPYIVSSEVSKVGKVAISANGADELFFGYDRMRESTERQVAHIFRAPLVGGTSWDESCQDPRIAELTTYVQFDLNKTLDFASMCHGLEVRVPFLNKSVIEKALSLPMARHIRGGRAKAILKDSLSKEGFSKEYTNRSKVGFSLHYSPYGYNELKILGVQLLKDRWGIAPDLHTGRDVKYFEASAAAFYCWHNVWKSKLIYSN